MVMGIGSGERRKLLLLLLLLAGLLVTTLGGGGRSLALALNTARAGTGVGRVERKVNVLLRLETNDERGRGDNLLTDAKG